MNIIPVPTVILLQMIPFFVSIIVLYYVLFKPMLRYLEEREENIIGSTQKALSLEQETQKKLADLQSDLKKVRQEIGEKRGQVRASLVKDYNDALHDARGKAEKTIEEQVKVLAEEQAQARKGLEGQAQEIASLIASQTLGRELTHASPSK